MDHQLYPTINYQEEETTSGIKHKLSDVESSVHQIQQSYNQAIKYSGYLDKRKRKHALIKKRRWFSIQDGDIFYYERGDSSKSLGRIKLQEVKDIVSYGQSFTIHTISRDYFLTADTMKLCKDWVSNIELAMSPYFKHENEHKKAIRADLSTPNSFDMCGNLKKLGVTGGWRERYFEYSPEEHTLSYMVSPGKPVLGYIHLDKILSIKKGVPPTISKKKGHRCIQVNTPGRNFILKAADDRLCELWYRTLWNEIVFIKKLMTEEKEMEKIDDLDRNVSGQLLMRDNDGTMKKRWIFFDEKNASIYILVSRDALEHAKTCQPLDTNLIASTIPIQTIVDIERVEEDMATNYQIRRDDVKLYFVIQTIKGKKFLFLCPTAQMKKSWIDALQILKEFYETSTEEADPQHSINRNNTKSLSLTLGITGSSSIKDMSKLRDAQESVMYRIRESEQIDVSQVEFTFSSLNHQDVFIVDTYSVIYQWNGKHANRIQKAKGLDLSSTINFKERQGDAIVRVIDNGSDMDEQMTEANEQFWALFGGIENESKVSSVQKLEAGSKPSLYRVSNHSNLEKALTRLRIPSRNKPSKDILNTKYVYVLETKDEVMIWIGQNSSASQTNLALIVAEHLLPEKESWVKIDQNFEGEETSGWKEKFCDYASTLPILEVPVEKDQCLLDVKGLLSPELKSKEGNIPFLETTIFLFQEMKIWRVAKFKKVEYPEELFGHFFAQDSFIILFSWMTKDMPQKQSILFTWQGSRTSSQNKAASALLTVDAGGSMEGDAIHIRIEQNKEPSEFIMLFQGKYVVHNGSYDTQPNRSRLYDVRGTSKSNTKAIEIESDLSRLNSLHCFVLLQPDKTNAFIWRGSRSLEVEYEHAERLASSLSSIVSEVKEGEELEEFFNVFAKRDGSYVRSCSHPSLRHYPRLFLCSQLSGTFNCEEEPFVCQEEFLQHNNCYILVPYSDQGCLFVWLGRSSNDFVKRNSLNTAQAMLKYLINEGISKAFVAYDGQETSEFYFSIHGWSNLSTGNRRSSIIAERQPPLASLDEVMKIYCDDHTYPYSVLLEKTLPEGVDPLKRESYLSEQDFNTVFDVSKREFYTYPLWKQQEMKKKVYLL